MRTGGLETGRSAALGAVLGALVLGAAARAGELPGDAMIRAYLSERAAKLEASFLPEARDGGAFRGLRPRLREEYLHMLGLWPLPEKGPLAAVVTGKLEREGITVEKLHFQSRDRLYVTGNLYRPSGAPGGRLPAVLYVCGHSGRGRNGNKTAFQDHGIWLARHGYVALLIDTLQLGEIAAIHHGTYREGRWWWHSAGYTPAGVECWNGVRAIDYLVSRDDVDPERIAVTGISGGGAATFWIAAADERVKAAVPVSGMADLQSYVSHEVVNGHCDCMFLYNTFRWNWTTIAALVAPRPLLFMNSDKDSIFPMDANERVIARLERLYGLLGAGDRVDTVVSVGGHDYRTDLRQAAFRWIGTWLKGDGRLVEDPDLGLGEEPGKPLIPPEDLRVFAGDGDIPRDQVNTRVDEVFVPRRVPELPREGGLDAWRAGLLRELGRVSFGAWPADAADAGMLLAQSGTPGETLLETQPGIQVHLRTVKGRSAGAPVWLVILGEEDQDAGAPDAPGEAAGLPAWARGIVKSEPAYLLFPRGVGPTAWTRKNPPNTVERSLALLGETADSGRIFDIIQAARWVKAASGASAIRLLGRGNGGVLAAYAAAHEPAVERVVAVEPPASHGPGGGGRPPGPAILNVLRVLDIPDAFGLLAPRRLEILGAEAGAFERTRRIYALAGAADALEIRAARP